MIQEVADGIFVRQSTCYQTNAVVIRDAAGLVMIDPGVHGSELGELSTFVRRLGLPVLAGFATHPHWDHVLWHPDFGTTVPRFATAACHATTRERLTVLRNETVTEAPEAPLELVGELVPLPAGVHHLPWPGRSLAVLEHRAHAPGHAALFDERTHVLVAGDMLSDVEVPLFDPDGADPAGEYLAALDLLSGLLAQVTMVIPGHGQIAWGAAAVAERFRADYAYVRAVAAGADPSDRRLAADASYGADWLPGAHQCNLRLARARQ